MSLLNFIDSVYPQTRKLSSMLLDSKTSHGAALHTSGRKWMAKLAAQAQNIENEKLYLKLAHAVGDLERGEEGYVLLECVDLFEPPQFNKDRPPEIGQILPYRLWVTNATHMEVQDRRMLRVTPDCPEQIDIYAWCWEEPGGIVFNLPLLNGPIFLKRENIDSDVVDGIDFSLARALVQLSIQIPPDHQVPISIQAQRKWLVQAVNSAEQSPGNWLGEALRRVCLAQRREKAWLEDDRFLRGV